MSKLGKTLGVVFAVLVLGVAAGITLTIGWRPFIGPRTRPLTAPKLHLPAQPQPVRPIHTLCVSPSS